jgi:hypothetical protein
MKRNKHGNYDVEERFVYLAGMQPPGVFNMSNWDVIAENLSEGRAADLLKSKDAGVFNG